MEYKQSEFDQKNCYLPSFDLIQIPIDQLNDELTPLIKDFLKNPNPQNAGQIRKHIESDERSITIISQYQDFSTALLSFFGSFPEDALFLTESFTVYQCTPNNPACKKDILSRVTILLNSPKELSFTSSSTILYNFLTEENYEIYSLLDTKTIIQNVLNVFQRVFSTAIPESAFDLLLALAKNTILFEDMDTLKEFKSLTFLFEEYTSPGNIFSPKVMRIIACLCADNSFIENLRRRNFTKHLVEYLHLFVPTALNDVFYCLNKLLDANNDENIIKDLIEIVPMAIKNSGSCETKALFDFTELLSKEHFKELVEHGIIDASIYVIDTSAYNTMINAVMFLARHLERIVDSQVEKSVVTDVLYRVLTVLPNIPNEEQRKVVDLVVSLFLFAPQLFESLQMEVKDAIDELENTDMSLADSLRTLFS